VRWNIWKSEFPNRAIEILNEDANAAVQRTCRDTDWRSNRAVLFLDPYGMQVSWETLVAVAATKAIDVCGCSTRQVWASIVS